MIDLLQIAAASPEVRQEEWEEEGRWEEGFKGRPCTEDVSVAREESGGRAAWGEGRRLNDSQRVKGSISR